MLLLRYESGTLGLGWLQTIHLVSIARTTLELKQQKAQENLMAIESRDAYSASIGKNKVSSPRRLI